MTCTTIGGLFGGIVLTVILVTVFIMLFKIVRKIFFVGLENNEIEVEDKEGSANKEGLQGEREDKNGDGGEEEELDEEDIRTTNGSSSVIEEDHRDDFWEVENDSPYSLPSKARYVKTETKYLQLALNNQSYLYEFDGSITVKITDDPIREQDTALRFKFHYFDLKNFSSKGRYIMIESEEKFIRNETQSETNHLSVLLRPGTSPSNTIISDDRFFRIQPKLNDDNKIHLLHLNSGLYLATTGGFVRTRAEFMYVDGNPPLRATFVPLDCKSEQESSNSLL